jgi:tetratricopeptide (TPR) repeat protein
MATRLNDYENAMGDMTSCIELSDARSKYKAVAYAHRGQYFAKMNRLSSAMADFAEAVRLRPDDFDA